MYSLDLSQASLSENPLTGPFNSNKATLLLRWTYLSINAGDFLDRAAFASPRISGRDDTSIGTLTEFLYELVLRVNHKGVVERLE